VAKVATPSKGNVVNLMEALQASIKTTGKNEPTTAAKAGKSAKKVSVEPPVDDVPPVDEPGKPPAELAAAAPPADPPPPPPPPPAALAKLEPKVKQSARASVDFFMSHPPGTTNLFSKRSFLKFFSSSESADTCCAVVHRHGYRPVSTLRASLDRRNNLRNDSPRKHRDRPYQAGRSPHWVKVKNPASPAMTAGGRCELVERQPRNQPTSPGLNDPGCEGFVACEGGQGRIT
jgi:hypothetical protein